MRLIDAMTALTEGGATLVDVTNFAPSDVTGSPAVDDDYERQVALG